MLYKKMKLYCKKCDKEYEDDVLISASSMFIEGDPSLLKKAQDGTLFKNYCPVCGEESEIKE